MNMKNFQEGEGVILFAEYMKFIKFLVVDLKADEIMLIFLLVIFLFSSDRFNISDKSYVCQEQEKYVLLFLRYLEFRYFLYIVRVIYSKLLMKFIDIRDLNEEYFYVLLKVNFEGIQFFMKEVLDMNLKDIIIGNCESLM